MQSEPQQADEEAAAEHPLAHPAPHPAAEDHPEQGRDEGDEGGAGDAEREGAAAGKRNRECHGGDGEGQPQRLDQIVLRQAERAEIGR